MNLPLVSIIIPVFNAEKTLLKTLESVFNQNYPNIQVLVIDGNSQDNSTNIIKEFSDIYYFVSENDSGIYDAMNKGIEKATGDYLFFLGADDFLRNSDVVNHVFVNIEVGDSSELPIVIYGNVENVDSTSSKTPSFHKGSFSSKMIWKNTLHHQGTFYCRSVFLDFRYDNKLKVLADYELNLILLQRNVKSKCFDFIVAVCQADGVSKNYSKKLYREELLIKKRVLSFGNYLIQIPWVWLKYLYKNVF